MMKNLAKPLQCFYIRQMYEILFFLKQIYNKPPSVFRSWILLLILLRWSLARKNRRPATKFNNSSVPVLVLASARHHLLPALRVTNPESPAESRLPVRCFIFCMFMVERVERASAAGFKHDAKACKWKHELIIAALQVYTFIYSVYSWTAKGLSLILVSHCTI